ncbi:MAG: hypothetical protein LC808_02010 [Actinobacteria bacterium]|nr:hypothetical protein [Actinomycetota bacterium]
MIPSPSASAQLTAPAAETPIIDTLAGATPSTRFSVFGTSGIALLPLHHAGPQFTLTEITTITEIGAFLNVCRSIQLGVPDCPNNLPVTVEVQRAVNGLPDPTAVIATFVLSHDDDPLTVSYESVATNLILAPGTYYAIFVPQEDNAGFILGTARGGDYVAGTPTLGTIRPDRIFFTEIPAAVRILGLAHDSVPTSKDQCKDGNWRILTDEQGKSFKNQGQCVSWVNEGNRKSGA